MIFKNRKVPKHLIIHDEYEKKAGNRFGFFKFLLMMVVMVSLTWVVSAGLIQI